MDGFTALGIAANICQFIDYGFKLVSQVNRARNHGAIGPDLERDTIRLKGVAGKLTQQPRCHDGLDKIATDCISLSQQLLDELSKATPKDPKSKWQSFKAVIRSESKKRDTADLEAKLERCRSQPNLELTEMTSREISEKLDKITQSGNALQSEVLALRDCLNQLQPALVARYIGEDISGLLKSSFNRMDNALNSVKHTSILNLVKFPGVHERLDHIADAHQETFEWLLSEPEDDKSLDPVLAEARWLQNDGSAFWIAGKPGAGKSTLMKSICLHKNLASHLEVWAAGSKLAMGSFFFWKPGTAAQKSIQGLFRGWLHLVLERSPDLIPTAFPELWNMADISTVMLTKTLEHRDILRAFQNMLQAALRTPEYKFAFFIDGLDEFEGRHSELLQELNSWMALYPRHVKCCVSSREYSIFQEHLSIHPTMRLHKLTERDISSLVDHRLSHISGQQTLNPSDIEQVRDVIIEKAEGVFLWVSLVLASVEDGLFSGDDISELVNGIQHCPIELEALFETLLKSNSSSGLQIRLLGTDVGFIPAALRMAS
ncbi:hypothetical protein PG988_004316 [Apiospora saccharicola]